MRNAFIDELVKLAAQHTNIALIVGDLGYSVVEPFADCYPDRFINAGVAEQNMTGLAAGMASEGYHVFTYSIANFPTFRCAEQIRNDVDYHKLPVTVVSVGGGVAYGALGYSHHAIQDYALMRVLPNMLIAAPGDPLEARACLRYLVANPQPSYLRLGKAGEPCYHSAVPEVKPGAWLAISGTKTKQTGDKVLLTTGAALDIALNWAGASEYIDHCICSMPLWSMDSKLQQAKMAEEYQTIETIEDHLIDGGFGSWMMESLMNRPDLLQRLRLHALGKSVCGSVGTQKMLHDLGGLSRL